MGLEIRNLSKKYGEKTVVDDISFSMDRPGVYALLGTNGAGKTTTIRMMLGILAKDAGEVLWNGETFSAEKVNVGYLAEERGLYPKYSLMDQLMYFASLRGVEKKEAERRIAYLAKRLQVEEYLYPNAVNAAPTGMLGAKKALRMDTRRTPKKKPMLADQLSKGNQQKIQLMVALISDPELLILDEPMSGLDPVNTDLIRDILREEIDKGKYLIMSSHQMATVEEFCTNITIMDRSKAVLQGNLNDIKKSYGRVHLYLKTEEEILPDIEAEGITLLSRKEFEYELKVSGEKAANRLLSRLVQRGVQVVSFSLREPSLHEIFVEKVGETHE